LLLPTTTSNHKRREINYRIQKRKRRKRKKTKQNKTKQKNEPKRNQKDETEEEKNVDVLSLFLSPYSLFSKFLTVLFRAVRSKRSDEDR